MFVVYIYTCGPVPCLFLNIYYSPVHLFPCYRIHPSHPLPTSPPTLPACLCLFHTARYCINRAHSQQRRFSLASSHVVLYNLCLYINQIAASFVNPSVAFSFGFLLLLLAIPDAFARNFANAQFYSMYCASTYIYIGILYYI